MRELPGHVGFAVLPGAPSLLPLRGLCRSFGVGFESGSHQSQFRESNPSRGTKSRRQRDRFAPACLPEGALFTVTY